MRQKLFAFFALMVLTASLVAYKGVFEKGNENGPAAAMTHTAIASPPVQNTPAPVSSSTPVPETITKKEDTVRLIAVGDILLGRGVRARLAKANKDYTYPFKKVSELLRKGDIVFGNLEEPITASTHSLTGIHEGGKYVLKNDPLAIEGLKYAGFNLFNLANNHILDFYEKGLLDTFEVLNKNGIQYAGAGRNLDEARKPALIEKNGLKIGMLAYTDMSEVLYKGTPQITFIAGSDKPGVAPRELRYIIEDIQKLRNSADILIISLHWGVEESFEIPKQQMEFAHAVLDCGADIILGHHPHQFQGIEIYKGKPIIYSLGNFIFDQNDPENQEAFILDLQYTNKKLTSFKAIPVRTVDKTQVVPQTGQGAKELLDRQLDLCEKLGSKCRIIEDSIAFDLDSYHQFTEEN